MKKKIFNFAGKARDLKKEIEDFKHRYAYAKKELAKIELNKNIAFDNIKLAMDHALISELAKRQILKGD